MAFSTSLVLFHVLSSTLSLFPLVRISPAFYVGRRILSESPVPPIHCKIANVKLQRRLLQREAFESFFLYSSSFFSLPLWQKKVVHMSPLPLSP